MGPEDNIWLRIISDYWNVHILHSADFSFLPRAHKGESCDLNTVKACLFYLSPEYFGVKLHFFKAGTSANQVFLNNFQPFPSSPANLEDRRCVIVSR